MNHDPLVSMLVLGACLFCPVFNQDSLQKDKLLNHLCVMQRAAYNVSSDEGDDDAGGKAVLRSRPGGIGTSREQCLSLLV